MLIKDFCSRLVPKPNYGRRKNCLTIPQEIVREPDPSTYSQQLELANGQFPQFNSPDISTVKIWPINPINEIEILVRNLSSEASAYKTHVGVEWSPWGIGMPRQQIGTIVTQLARLGDNGSEQKLLIPTPPAVKDAGLFGIFTTVSHPYDKDQSNNQGMQMVDGFQTSVQRHAQFVFPVRNPSSTSASINVLLNSSDWGATVMPSTFTLNSGQQQDVTLVIQVPDTVHAAGEPPNISREFNVMAMAGQQLIGGLCIMVQVDD